jgi:hypothetical protein
MRPADAPAVLAIYQDGLDSGEASFETTAPDWAAFDAAKLPEHRWVATDPASSPASFRRTRRAWRCTHVPGSGSSGYASGLAAITVGGAMSFWWSGVVLLSDDVAFTQRAVTSTSCIGTGLAFQHEVVADGEPPRFR